MKYTISATIDVEAKSYRDAIAIVKKKGFKWPTAVTLPEETLRQVVDAEKRYTVSREGVVMVDNDGKTSSLKLVDERYGTVSVFYGKTKKTKKIRDLVWEAFVGKIPYGMKVITKVEGDYSLENLELR